MLILRSLRNKKTLPQNFKIHMLKIVKITAVLIFCVLLPLSPRRKEKKKEKEKAASRPPETTSVLRFLFDFGRPASSHAGQRVSGRI